jgi:Fe-S-cluster containining protein
MIMPAIATRTFKMFQEESSFRKLVKRMTQKISKISDPVKRARFVHKKINEEIESQFKDQMVGTLVQCKKGCSACCHSQVAITHSEALLIAEKVEEGVGIDYERLHLQAKAGNSAKDFFQLTFEERACVFLNDKNQCSIYEDRPSVCRTNYVLSDPKNCEIRKGQSPSVQLLNTFSADTWVYSYFKLGNNNGALAFLLQRVLKEKDNQIKFPLSKEY